MIYLQDTKVEFDILENDNSTKRLYTLRLDPIIYRKGSVLDEKYQYICGDCNNRLEKGKVSNHTSANGL